jgi:pimeloyl-ACP methyl ester carboxylesterase
MPYINNEGMNMFYEDIGVGEPVVFIHGSFSRGIIAFASQIQKFQFAHRCFFPDLRGHGRTSAKDMHWNTPQLADDVIFLMDQLGIAKAHVVGHSMGGDIAMYCAVKYPSRMITLTSIGSGGAVNNDITSYMELYNPEKIDMVKYHNFIESIKKDHFMAHNGDWETFLNETIINCAKYPDFTDADLQKITAPFLLIYGERDAMVKSEEINRLERNIEIFTALKIEGAGHFPHMIGKKGEEVNNYILDFLKRH